MGVYGSSLNSHLCKRISKKTPGQPFYKGGVRYGFPYQVARKTERRCDKYRGFRMDTNLRGHYLVSLVERIASNDHRSQITESKLSEACWIGDRSHNPHPTKTIWALWKRGITGPRFQTERMAATYPTLQGSPPMMLASTPGRRGFPSASRI
jgi:hypothetical protein